MKTRTWDIVQRTFSLAVLVFNLSAIQPIEAETFRAASRMIDGRYLHTATLLTDGQVFVVGGICSTTLRGLSATVTSRAELCEPANNTWTTTATWKTTDPVPVPGPDEISREAHTATLLENGQVLVAGGESDLYLTDMAELYDTATGTWKETGKMANARSCHTATLLPNGKVLVAGGKSSKILVSGHATYGEQTQATAELYDPTTGKWVVTGNMTKSREDHTATLLRNGLVLVAGGLTYHEDDRYQSSAELYNPATGKWRPTSPMKHSHAHHTATLLPDGKVLVTGGGFLVGDMPLATSIAELYDPRTETWSLTGSMNVRRMNHTATLLPDGKVLVTGGDASAELLAETSAEEYNPATGTWSLVGGMTTPRVYHTATLLPNGEVIFIGGTCGQFTDRDDLQFLSSQMLRSPASLASTEVYGNIAPILPVPPMPLTAVPPLASIDLNKSQTLPTGAFRLSFENTPGASFTVLASTNLLLPIINWTVLGPANEVSYGQYQFIDPQATNFPQRFYRLRSP